MNTIFRKVPVSEKPPTWGWYDTDKGKLFWYQMESAWSCNEHRLSEEYPKFWYQEIELPSEEELDNEFKVGNGSPLIDLAISSAKWHGAKYILDKIFK